MPGNELVQSLARGLDIVRLLAESDRPLRVRDIVAAAGLKRATVHNLLRTLASRDFVAKSGVMYQVGPALYTLVARDSSSLLLKHAKQAVGLLAERLPDAIVSYSEPVGCEVIVRFRQFPKQFLMERNSGATMLPYQTASGLTVLTFGGPEVRQRIAMCHPFQLEGISLWQTEARLEEFLEEARKKGLVIGPFGCASTFRLVGLPYLSLNGELIGVFGAAWNVTPDAEDGGIRQVVAALREAAQVMGTETVSGV